MYTVTIYDKSKRIFKSYPHITCIKYFDQIDEWISVSDDEILVHTFPLTCNYHLLSASGNYAIDSSIIGSLEIVKET